MSDQEKIDDFIVELYLQNREDRRNYCFQEESLKIIDNIVQNNNLAAAIRLFSKIDERLQNDLTKRYVTTSLPDRYKIKKEPAETIEQALDVVDFKKLLAKGKYLDFERKLSGFGDDYKIFLLFDIPNLFVDMISQTHLHLLLEGDHKDSMLERIINSFPQEALVEALNSESGVNIFQKILDLQLISDDIDEINPDKKFLINKIFSGFEGKQFQEFICRHDFSERIMKASNLDLRYGGIESFIDSISLEKSIVDQGYDVSSLEFASQLTISDDSQATVGAINTQQSVENNEEIATILGKRGIVECKEYSQESDSRETPSPEIHIRVNRESKTDPRLSTQLMAKDNNKSDKSL